MNLNAIISETVAVGGKRDFVREAVNRILSEDIQTGQTVAVVDDPISGYTGAKGRVRAISDSNPGFATVSLENGTEVQMQTSLLVPVA